jgi:hypothetical protein
LQPHETFRHWRPPALIFRAPRFLRGRDFHARMPGTVFACRGLYVAAGIEDHHRERRQRLCTRMLERGFDRPQRLGQCQFLHVGLLIQRIKPRVNR